MSVVDKGHVNAPVMSVELQPSSLRAPSAHFIESCVIV